MNSNNAISKKEYTVIKLTAENKEIQSRFYKLGIYPGVTIELKRKAPIFNDPLLFKVNGSQIALTKDEASYIEIEMKQDH